MKAYKSKEDNFYVRGGVSDLGSEGDSQLVFAWVNVIILSITWQVIFDACISCNIAC